MLPTPGPLGEMLPPRLPRGRHNLSEDFVSANQRRRLFLATGAALAEHGYSGFTVRHVIEGANVSRSTFYNHFEDKRHCVLVAQDDAYERLLAVILSACGAAREWPEKVAAAIDVFLTFVAAEPGAMSLLGLGSAADRAIVQQASEVSARFAAMLRDGGRQTPLGRDLPDLIEEAMIGAIVGIVAGLVLELSPPRRERLRAELVQLVLTPYLGLEEATRVARETGASGPRPAAE